MVGYSRAYAEAFANTKAEEPKKKRGRPRKHPVKTKPAKVYPDCRADFGAPMVMGDITPFQSPVDGDYITSRSKLRAHEQKHGIKQCGDFRKGEIIAKQKKRAEADAKLAETGDNFMGLNAEAASGPSDNAGKAKMGIDDAISAAVGASDTKDVSAPVKKEEETPKGEPKVKAKAKPAEAEPEAEPAETAGDETPSEDASKDAAKPKDVEEEEDASLSAPKHWPDADKQAFAKLPREAQEIILRKSKDLEGGFTRKSQELSDKAKYADNVRGLIGDQRRAVLQSQGIDEMAYLKRLNDIYAMAEQDPVGYIKWAMQSMGVTPDKLGISQAPPQTPPTGEQNPDEEIAKLLQDPKVAQLEAALQTLQGKVDQEEQRRQQALQAQRANAINTLNTHIRGFREALDDTGQLQYPHFDTVKAHMGALMDTDPDLSKMPDGPDKLKAAYDMAVWARPDLRQSLIKSEAQKEIQEAQKKKDAERAKRVTGVKPAAGVVSTKPKTNSLDDALLISDEQTRPLGPKP